MIKIKSNFNAALNGLKNITRNLRPARTRVGYRSPYAVYVHENTQMKLKGQPRPSGAGNYWDAKQQPGNPKFLEGPARELANQGILAKVFRRRIRIDKVDGVSVATKAAAQEILERSLQEVPYETGRLHNSAFIEEEK